MATKAAALKKEKKVKAPYVYIDMVDWLPVWNKKKESADDTTPCLDAGKDPNTVVIVQQKDAVSVARWIY